MKSTLKSIKSILSGKIVRKMTGRKNKSDNASTFVVVWNSNIYLRM